jgi:DAK2 domain fusion protein YloV
MNQQASITGAAYRRMIAGAYATFLREHETINRLNVFPVPDGDTGTNMLLTLQAVARTVNEAPEEGIGSLAKRAADSALMGARGNSGVILSQIFRGMSRGLRGKETAKYDEIGKAFQYGILHAYRAVSRPVEGTILTVAKGIAKGAHRAIRDGKSFEQVLREAIRAGREELDRTPKLLPALAAAGVVDAGGLGLIVFLEGCLEGLTGGFAAPEAWFDSELHFAGTQFEQADPTHPFCTEFIVQNCAVNPADVRQHLEEMGNSLIVGEGDSSIKVHIHTAHPGTIIELASAWGALSGIKIENMLDQNKNFRQHKESSKKLAVVAVAGGLGLSKLIEKMGADIIISGGQTMNPPVEEFVNAIHSGQAEEYIILPNNRNIVLAAVQVQKIVGARVHVVPSRSIPEGIAALLGFNPDRSASDNVEEMTRRIETVKSGAITIAIRDSQAEGRHIPAGRWIGVIDNQVLCDAETSAAALTELIRKLTDEKSELVSLYWGDDLDCSAADKTLSDIRQIFPAFDVQMYEGNQPHYHWIVGVE